MKFFRSEKGSFTVEAIIVFSISFMTIIFMMYMGVVMYQHVHLQSVTDRIASRGAMMYSTRTTDMKTGYKSKDAFWDSDPYRYIYDGSYKNTAESSIQAALSEAIGKGNVIDATGGQPKANVHLGLFTRKVVVEGNRKFNVPFSSVFGINNSMFNLNVKSTAYIMDMPETIRNVDYVTDILLQNETVNRAVSKVSELKNKLETFISKIK